MATFDYGEILTTAQELLTEFGKTIVVRKLDNSAANPAQPWRGQGQNTAVAAQEETLQAVAVTPASLIDLSSKAQAFEGLDQRTNEVYIAAPASLGAPDISDFDEVVDGAKIRRIAEMDILQPADDVLLYFIWVRT